MIPGSTIQTDNGIPEKYCYDDIPDNCDKYGGLYQWDEMLQFSTKNGQGICPDGWHISKDEEWKILEGTIDSQYGVGDSEWEKSSTTRGFDAGKTLKSTYDWEWDGNGVDSYGFAALPGGIYSRHIENFSVKNHETWWWNTIEPINSGLGCRGIYSDNDGIPRYHYLIFGKNNSDLAQSVRCVRN